MARKLFSQGQGKRETIEKIKSDNFRGPFTGPSIKVSGSTAGPFRELCDHNLR